MDVKPKFLHTETGSVVPSCVEASALNARLKVEEEDSVDCEENEEGKIDDSLVVMRGENFVVTLNPDYLEEMGEDAEDDLCLDSGEDAEDVLCLDSGKDTEDVLRLNSGEDVEDALCLDSSPSPGGPALPPSPAPYCPPSGWEVPEASEGAGFETGVKRPSVRTWCGGPCSSDLWGQPQVCYEGTAKKRKREAAVENHPQNSQRAPACVLPERKAMPCTDSHRVSAVRVGLGFAFWENDQLYIVQSQMSGSVGNHSRGGGEMEKYHFNQCKKEAPEVKVDWKKHQCPMCERTFAQKGTMELHIMIVHKGRRVGSGSGGNF